MANKTTGLDGIAERYAVALYDLADGQGALDQVATDLRSVIAHVAAIPELQRLLVNPVLKRDVQSAGALAVADALQLSALTRNLIGVLGHNRRLAALVPVAEAYLARLAAKRGEVTAVVTSASPLTNDQIDALVAKLKAATGAKIQIDQRVDASLIGGLIVKVGSTLVDQSLKTKLMRLQLAMKGVA